MSDRSVVIKTPASDVMAMPNQIEGTINGTAFYFRARHGEWTLDLGDKEIASGSGEKLGLWQEEPGWWTGEDALAFCRTVIGKYLDGIYGRGKGPEEKPT
jgi:hypothetical protein